MVKGPLRPAHRAIKAYYETLAQYGDQHVAHEGALRSAFQTLLADTARAHGWTLIPELGAKVGRAGGDTGGGTGVSPVSHQGGTGAPPVIHMGGTGGGVGVSPGGVGVPPANLTRTIRPDGTIRDANSLPRGYWEAKDTSDDLDAEIVKKAAKGYSLVNTIFEDTRTAVLYQGNREAVG